MRFGPQNKEEAEIFALEELRADIQYEILRGMKHLGLSQADFAKRMGTSSARVSQMLGDEANLTLESVSKAFLTLGSKCHVSSSPLEAHYHDAIWQEPLVGFDEWEEDQIALVDVDRHEAVDTSTMLGDSMAYNDGEFTFSNDTAYNAPQDRCLEAA